MPGDTYFLLLAAPSYQQQLSSLQQYAVGTAAAPAAGAMWTLARGGAWAVDPKGRAPPLGLSTPAPPAGFGPSQLHRDWVAFQCEVNARYTAAMASAMSSAQQVRIFSGYSGDRDAHSISATFTHDGGHFLT